MRHDLSASPGPEARAPVIDAHHHVWDLDRRDQPWTADLPRLRRSFDYGELVPHLDDHGVDATVVVQTVADPAETPELLDLARAEPRIGGVVGWTDLTDAGVADELARLRELPGGQHLVGIRHPVQAEPDPGWLLRPDVVAGLSAVAAAGLVYDVLVTQDQLPAVVAMARRLPEVQFVLDHAGKPTIAADRVAQTGAGRPSKHWSGQITALADLDNVACKLSGLVTEAEVDWDVTELASYADRVLSAFGPDRVMLGSDWPVCLLRGSYDTVAAAHLDLVADLDPLDMIQVRGGTAARWYSLDLDLDLDEGTQ